MNKYNPVSERIKRNIEYLMQVHNITSVNALSKILNIPATTIYSFLNNPLSNSKVKFKICDYFNINFEELESIDLYNLETNNDNNIEVKSNQSILSMTDDDFLNYLNAEKSNNAEIDSLKSSINSLLFTNFRKCCGQAKIEYMSENYQKALYSISSAFWLLKPDEIKYITENDLLLYVNIAKHFNDSDFIYSLIIKMESSDYFNYKILLVLANLLETDFPNEAKLCLNLVKQKGL